MTKRIFAIVLALVMSLSMFAVNVFAATTLTVVANGGAGTLTATWTAVDGAATYNLSYWKGETELAVVKDLTTTTHTLGGLQAGNDYYVKVRAYDTNGGALTDAVTSSTATVTASGSGTATGVIYSAYFGPYLVTKYTDKAVVTWTATAGAAQYRVIYTVDGGTKVTKLTGATSIEIPAAYTESFTIEVTAASSSALLGSYGTQTVPSGTTGGSSVGTGTTTTSGNLVITKGTTSSTVTWTAVSGATGYVVEYQKSTATSASSTYVTTNAATVACGTSDTWTVTVKAIVSNNLVTIGSATVYPGSSSNTGSSGVVTSGTLTVTKGTSSSVVKWNAVSGATAYIVNYKKVGASVTESSYVSATQVTVPYGSSDSWIVEVRAIVSSNLVSVGSATVTPGSTTSGTTTSTVTTNGSNCTVLSSYNSSVVTWNATGSTFLVIYTETGKEAKSTTVTSKSVTIPVGYNTSFTVYVYNMTSGSLCASATVKATSTGTTSTVTKTEIKNLDLTYSGSWNTVVSWDKVSGAQFYQIDHALLGAQAGESEVTTKAELTLPYGKNINFQVIVTAFMADGTKKTVGYAYHVAGTSASTDSTTTTTPDVETVEEYDTVTGFWAETLGDGLVKLTWNAVEDCSTYKVYYRKVGATKWSGGHSRTKTNITIDFGSKTSAYEFKIVAGDEESTVLTIKPNADQGTVAWAANPDSDADFETNLYGEVLNAKTGKIKFTWDKDDDVKSYKVYYRKAGTTTWKGGYERNSSLTITFKEDNIGTTYEIKIVADGEDSDIFTLKPAVWANAQ